MHRNVRNRLLKIGSTLDISELISSNVVQKWKTTRYLLLLLVFSFKKFVKIKFYLFIFFNQEKNVIKYQVMEAIPIDYVKHGSALLDNIKELERL